MLLPHGIQVEDRGGDVQAIPISALNGTNLDTLTEAIVLQAELMNLKGDPRGRVEGVVVESRTDLHRGYGCCTWLWFRCSNGYQVTSNFSVFLLLLSSD